MVVLQSVDDLPPEAAGEAEYFRQSGMRSHLGIPVRVGGHIVGGIGFASFKKTQAWAKPLITRVQLLGQVFTLALARKHANENLAAALAEIERLKEENPILPSKKAICSNFGLTAAEADIALGIIRGENLASIAAVRGITLSTARTQLKTVFSKLGAHQQSQIAALLSRKLF
jgi:DNA-binding CsgD family transcriptional regulator